jgi:hypothetical protein
MYLLLRAISKQSRLCTEKKLHLVISIYLFIHLFMFSSKWTFTLILLCKSIWKKKDMETGARISPRYEILN